MGVGNTTYNIIVVGPCTLCVPIAEAKRAAVSNPASARRHGHASIAMSTAGIIVTVAVIIVVVVVIGLTRRRNML